MVNYFIYAKDFSASTNKSEYYHSNGLKTLEEFKNDVVKIKKELVHSEESPAESKIIYLHWGYECEEVDEGITSLSYLNQAGHSAGTYPETIVEWVQENCNIYDENSKIKLLYIITDGLIGQKSVENCFRINENMHYEMVAFHAFNENRKKIDFSVASSFFKSRCVVYCNYELYDNINISIEFDYNKINVDNFHSEMDNLSSYIKLKFLNNSKARALEEIEKLKKLRAQLFKELLLKTQEKCEVNLETKDRTVFIREFTRTSWYKSLNTPMHTTKTYVEKAITTMINYLVSENKSYSFDVLKFNKEFDKCVVEEPIVDVNFTAEQEIAFPDIILEDEKGIPVVILATLDLLNKLIFHGQYSENIPPARFSRFKSTMGCPLFLVNDRDISESIGYFYTFNVYKHLLANNRKTEPRTRKPFHGGLVLIDTDEFDKYNDYILSVTYFNSKKVNFNVGLFYYVLWKNCENKEWMDGNVVEQFKKYVMRRISNTVCKIGLSSLPLDPQKKTSLLTALWYCVDLSSCIFKNDPQHFSHERLKMFYRVAHCMVEILQYFGYDLDLNSIERRRELIMYSTYLKKLQGKEKIYHLLSEIFKTIDGFLVSEIKKPYNLYKLNYLKLDHKKMLKDEVIEETVHLNEYVHLMYFEDHSEESDIEICEKTFRPFFAIDQSNSFYTKLIKKTKNVVISNDDDKDKIKVSFEAIDSLEFDRVLSLYNLFIRCVTDLKKYPTLPEYIQYVLDKKIVSDDLITIFPSNVHFDIKDVYEHYQKIVTKVNVKKFIEVTKAHANRLERIKSEERVRFNSVDEINEFISNEELKVNLKKKTWS